MAWPIIPVCGRHRIIGQAKSNASLKFRPQSLRKYANSTTCPAGKISNYPSQMQIVKRLEGLPATLTARTRGFEFPETTREERGRQGQYTAES